MIAVQTAIWGCG